MITSMFETNLHCLIISDKRFEFILLTKDERSELIYLKILVKPRSKEQKIIFFNEVLNVHLKSAPVGGKANKELITYLSKSLFIPKNNLRLVKGHKSRDKVISISNELLENLSKKLTAFS